MLQDVPTDREPTSSNNTLHTAQANWVPTEGAGNHDQGRSQTPFRTTNLRLHNWTWWKSLVSSHMTVEPEVPQYATRSTQLVRPAQSTRDECRHKFKKAQVNIGLANWNVHFFYSLAQGANHIFAFRFCGQRIETNDNIHFSPNQPPSSTCLLVKSLKCFTCFYIP